jgi:hypothetical protein
MCQEKSGNPDRRSFQHNNTSRVLWFNKVPPQSPVMGIFVNDTHQGPILRNPISARKVVGQIFAFESLINFCQRISDKFVSKLFGFTAQKCHETNLF